MRVVWAELYSESEAWLMSLEAYSNTAAEHLELELSNIIKKKTRPGEGVKKCMLTLIGMRQGTFTSLVILGLDFVS